MRNRLYGYICILILLEILQAISHAKIIDEDTRRRDNVITKTKREISQVVVATSQPRGNISHAREINSGKKGDADLAKDDRNLGDRRKVSKRSANPDVQQSNVEKSIGTSRLNSNVESDYGEKIAEREEDVKEETSDLVRSPRDVDLEKYVDQDERSSLYDDYEAKDVAKRGVLGGPGDYEEAENDSTGLLEDTASFDEGETGGIRESDSRMKRDRETISGTFDKSESSNSAKLDESPEVAKNPFARQVSRVESLESFNRRGPSSSGDPASDRLNEVISRSSDFTENEIPTGVIILSGEDEGSKYGKRVEEEIQRKIESIKEEIKRDIEAQQRIKDIEDNNARFDELWDQEDEERRGLESEPIEKRQIGKRSIREIASSSSERDDEKRCLKRERRDELQHRSGESIDRSDTWKENESLKRRFAINRDKSFGQAPSMGLVKRKRERVRQTFLVNNDRTKKRHTRSYSSSSDRTASKPENELFTDLNSYHYTNDGMLEASSPVIGEDEDNDGEQSPVAERSNSLASLTGSSQELSPRLAREYKEAFGGLQ